MRIAQVAPLYESVPPKFYGGTERIVSYLTETLLALGHDVTLFASGDSKTGARLVKVVPRALRLFTDVVDPIVSHVLLLQKVLEQRDRFDVIHFHCDYLHFPLSRLAGLTQLTTLHGSLDIRDLYPLYKEFTDMPLVSISDRQREPLPFSNWLSTVYHGLPLDLYEPRYSPDNYIAFLGRISPEKGIERAIKIAQSLKVPLKVAAKIDLADRDYFTAKVEPLFKLPGVEYVGEINELEKRRFLGNARCLLFPIDWPEPFGLVMIESLACGTPVLAFNRGSVPEIIEPGITGYIAETTEQAIALYPKVVSLDRKRVRERFCERFSAECMALNYLALYQQLTTREPSTEGHRHAQ